MSSRRGVTPRLTSSPAGSALANVFTIRIVAATPAERALATRRLGRRAAVLTFSLAVALLDGAATPPIDVDSFIDGLVTEGNTVDEVVQAASVLFGLAVVHIGLERDETQEAIASAVNRAILTWLTPAMVAFGRVGLDNPAQDSSLGTTARPRLTRREKDVLAALALSVDSNTVCKNLAISVHTLRHHITSLCRKLGARNRFEILLKAQRCGLL